MQTPGRRCPEVFEGAHDQDIAPATSQQKAWAADIQVNHLLTHTAGFGKVGEITDLDFAPNTAWR